MRFEIDVSASFSRFFRAGVDLDTAELVAAARLTIGFANLPAVDLTVRATR
jgi:hypothetical protein